MTPKEKLRHDLYRYSGSTHRRINIKFVLLHPGARFMFLFRMCNRYNNKNVLGIFFRIWFRLLSNKYNIEIPHKTKIGPGLYMGHFKNIIINQNTIIGTNCNIHQGVTIGRESRGKREGCPEIGNYVLIGVNSVVVGHVKVGDNVLIAPLTLVNSDIPVRSVVMGSPGKIVSNNGSCGYINKTFKDSC